MSAYIELIEMVTEGKGDEKVQQLIEEAKADCAHLDGAKLTTREDMLASSLKTHTGFAPVMRRRILEKFCTQEGDSYAYYTLLLQGRKDGCAYEKSTKEYFEENKRKNGYPQPRRLEFSAEAPRKQKDRREDAKNLLTVLISEINSDTATRQGIDLKEWEVIDFRNNVFYYACDVEEYYEKKRKRENARNSRKREGEKVSVSQQEIENAAERVTRVKPKIKYFAPDELQRKTNLSCQVIDWLSGKKGISRSRIFRNSFLFRIEGNEMSELLENIGEEDINFRSIYECLYTYCHTHEQANNFENYLAYMEIYKDAFLKRISTRNENNPEFFRENAPESQEQREVGNNRYTPYARRIFAGDGTLDRTFVIDRDRAFEDEAEMKQFIEDYTHCFCGHSNGAYEQFRMLFAHVVSTMDSIIPGEIDEEERGEFAKGLLDKFYRNKRGGKFKNQVGAITQVEFENAFKRVLCNAVGIDYQSANDMNLVPFIESYKRTRPISKRVIITLCGIYAMRTKMKNINAIYKFTNKALDSINFSKLSLNDIDDFRLLSKAAEIKRQREH